MPENTRHYFKTVAEIFSLAGAKSFRADFEIYLSYQRRGRSEWARLSTVDLGGFYPLCGHRCGRTIHTGRKRNVVPTGPVLLGGFRVRRI